jgi:hypothetical protein
MKIWVDPPEGWKHGFPAIFCTETDGDLRPWIIKRGYPEQKIIDYGDCFWVRSWPADEIDQKQCPDRDINAKKSNKDITNAPIGTEQPESKT